MFKLRVKNKYMDVYKYNYLEREEETRAKIVETLVILVNMAKGEPRKVPFRHNIFLRKKQ